MRKSNKVLALLLAILMLATALPMSIFAAEEDSAEATTTTKAEDNKT